MTGSTVPTVNKNRCSRLENGMHCQMGLLKINMLPNSTSGQCMPVDETSKKSGSTERNEFQKKPLYTKLSTVKTLKNNPYIK